MNYAIAFILCLITSVISALSHGGYSQVLANSDLNVVAFLTIAWALDKKTGININLTINRGKE